MLLKLYKNQEKSIQNIYQLNDAIQNENPKKLTCLFHCSFHIFVSLNFCCCCYRFRLKLIFCLVYLNVLVSRLAILLKRSKLSILKFILYDFLVTVKAASHESVIRTG